MTQLTPEMRRSPAFWIASGFGCGLAPKAPGTVATFLAVIPWLAMRELPLLTYALIVLATFAVGVWAAGRVIELVGKEDPGIVVIDEWAGLWIGLLALPDGLPWLLAGVLLFRLFDIAKPWPVSWADRRLHGGIGAMLDDALAGIYTLLMLQAVAWLLPRWGF
jgi:phosphatidylglycerophosphatase A